MISDYEARIRFLEREAREIKLSIQNLNQTMLLLQQAVSFFRLSAGASS